MPGPAPPEILDFFIFKPARAPFSPGPPFWSQRVPTTKLLVGLGGGFNTRFKKTFPP